MSRPHLAMWFLGGILAVIGLGVLAGHRLADWRADRIHDAAVAKLQQGEASALRIGDPFPEVELVGQDGRHTHTSDLFRNTDALIVFVAPGCDGCTEALLHWNPYVQTDPVRPPVIGIARAKAEEADIYARETGLGFPVLADEEDVFGTRYGLHALPTVIGVRAGGAIAFIRHGISEDFTPERAEEMLGSPPR